MNKKEVSVFKGFSVTFLANIISMLVSSFMYFVLSKEISVAGFGYWQFYLLCCSYIGFANLGIPDGYYVRKSGTDYEHLDKGLIRGLLRFLIVLTLGLAVIFSLASFLLSPILFADTQKMNLAVLLAAAAAACFIIPRVFIQFVWQTAARFNENAFIIIIERLIFIFLVFAFLLLRLEHVLYLFAADILAKAIALIIALIMARDVLRAPKAPSEALRHEISADIRVGLSLMLASVSSSLLIGINQIAIKSSWGIETYSKIALTLSLSNLLMVFINALALVLLPFIRRSDDKANLKLHAKSRRLLVMILFISLNLYYPFRLFTSYFLPKYKEGIAYMAILFPLCIFESKNQLLTNTFLKAYRKERRILHANLAALALCLLLSLLFASVFNNLSLTVLSLLIVLIFRSVLSEYFLSCETKLSYFKENIVEILLTAAFVISQRLIGGLKGALVYAFVTLIYLVLNRDALKALLKQIRKLFRKKA